MRLDAEAHGSRKLMQKILTKLDYGTLGPCIHVVLIARVRTDIPITQMPHTLLNHTTAFPQSMNAECSYKNHWD